MNRKSAFLLLAVVVGSSSLLPGVAAADRGYARGHDRQCCEHGRYERGYANDGKHHHHQKHHRKHDHGPRVVYRDRPGLRHAAQDSLTIIFNGRLR